MRADAKENRLALITAAKELFAEQGSDVSLRAIAAEANVGIGTLYRHFPTRDALITAVLVEISVRVRALINRHVAEWDDAAPEKAWTNCIQELVGLQLAALGERMISQLPEDGRVWQATAPDRELLAEAYSKLLAKGAEANLVAADIDPWRFHLGLVAFARPLPTASERLAPGQSQWLVKTFLAGLRPQRQ